MIVKTNVIFNNVKTYVCKYCGRNFQRRGTKIPVYCSRKCKAEHAKERSGSIRTCPVCDKEFYAKGNPKNRVYCSRKCAGIARVKGKIIKCDYCAKKIYKYKVHLKYKNHFCSIDCANKYQARNKREFICKICGKKFRWSKSRGIARYCSIKCRNKDPEWKKNACIKGNVIQQFKKGLNKLELAGREILQDLEIEFDEQVLMFDKFLVDVLLKSKPIAIQWDGEYWHNKPKRKILDKSQDAYLKKCGYRVIRVTDRDIKNRREQVCANIKQQCSKLPERLGRHYIGYETGPENVKIAKARLSTVESMLL